VAGGHLDVDPRDVVQRDQDGGPEALDLERP
jgi:hypothetical protein